MLAEFRLPLARSRSQRFDSSKKCLGIDYGPFVTNIGHWIMGSNYIHDEFRLPLARSRLQWFDFCKFFFLSLDLSLSTPWYAGVWFLVINDKFRLLLVSQDRKGLAPQRMFMHLLINLL